MLILFPLFHNKLPQDRPISLLPPSQLLALELSTLLAYHKCLLVRPSLITLWVTWSILFSSLGLLFSCSHLYLIFPKDWVMSKDIIPCWDFS